jgi:histone-lysine N-methyltransferase SETMAR
VGKDEEPEATSKPDPHGKKVMLSVWWSVRGVEYWELLPPGCTINAQFYTTQLRNLKARLDSTREKGSRIHFLHDNARPHIAKSVKAELATYGWWIIPHPPYSPDLAQATDYWLFSHLQRFLDNKNFKKEDEVKNSLKSES